MRNSSQSRLAVLVAPILKNPAHVMLLVIALLIAATLSTLAVIRVSGMSVHPAPAADAADAVGSPNFAALAAGDRATLVAIEVGAGKLAAQFAAGENDPAAALAEIAEMQAGIRSLRGKVPESFRKALLEKTETAGSLFHEGKNEQALPVLRDLRASLTSARNLSS